MTHLKNIFLPHNLRGKIILTFSIVSIIIVVATARISYMFVKDIYIEQLAEQVKQYSHAISVQFKESYLRTLPLGALSPLSHTYFQDILNRNTSGSTVQEAFVFDNEFKLIVHSDAEKKLYVVESRLLLNKSEIDTLHIGESVTSLPFKGRDDKWYMWGFIKLADNYYLGVRESAHRLAKVEQFSIYFWLIGLVGIILTMIAGMFLANRIVTPINKLVEFSRQIGERNFSSNKPERVTGELKILADAMELMKDRLNRHHSEKEEMLARIAHEIRNPLGGIELLANLTKEDLVKDGRNPEYISKILDEVAGLKELITAYLNFSKPMSPSPAWCDLEDTIPATSDIYHKRLREKNIKLDIEIKNRKVWFDPAHLRNIILNLVANSIDSIQGEGTISISTLSENGTTDIIVADTGCGIDAAAVPNIFEPFFTTKNNGTGLGLAISKKLCEENNAKLSILETGNIGTAFKIEIKNKHE